MVWDNQCRMVDDPDGEARKIPQLIGPRAAYAKKCETCIAIGRCLAAASHFACARFVFKNLATSRRGDG